MRAGRVALAALLLADGAAAAGGVQLLDGPAFAARVTGLTLHWAEGGAPAGAETYLPDQRVIWRGPAGTCRAGRWTADGPRICFTYVDSPRASCWLFANDRTGLVARGLSGEGAPVLRSSAETTVPLTCGPAFGA